MYQPEVSRIAQTIERFHALQITDTVTYCTAILACINVNGLGGRLIQPRITIHVTFASFWQCSDDGVLRITSRLA